LHLDGDVHVEVFADRAALERALLAIVHNAIKYGRGGGHVTIRVSADAQYAHIDISDDGPGFSPSALEHALERFWRDDASRSADGTGLGLAIARSTIEACDGTLAIANRPGGGALVRCRLRRS
jgi:signal transduction histidine kinase